MVVAYVRSWKALSFNGFNTNWSVSLPTCNQSGYYDFHLVCAKPIFMIICECPVCSSSLDSWMWHSRSFGPLFLGFTLLPTNIIPVGFNALTNLGIPIFLNNKNVILGRLVTDLLQFAIDLFHYSIVITRGWCIFLHNRNAERDCSQANDEEFIFFCNCFARVLLFQSPTMFLLYLSSSCSSS